MNGLAKSKSQLAASYGIDRRTFNKWLKAVNIILPRGLICPKQQMEIAEKLGKWNSDIRMYGSKNKSYLILFAMSLFDLLPLLPDF
jgi:abortive infection bacteriophage resistance protein